MQSRPLHRGIAALLCVALVPSAWADARKIQVLKSEGKVDANVKTRIDAAIIKLARTTDSTISPGDITMSDAATAVGCKIEAAGCKEQVLDMLGVDEVVYATVVAKPNATEVTAYRVSKGEKTREARSTILAGNSPDKIDGVAALFVSSASPAHPHTPPPVLPPPPGTPAVTTTTTVETTRTIENPPPVEPALAPEAAPPTNADTIAYVPQDDPAPPSKLPLVGMIGGGVVVLLSFASWSKASDIQGQIDDAPANTAADIMHIRTLEDDGKSAAGTGNLLFLAGAVLGGVSTYFYIKQRRARSQSPQLGATLLPNSGVGITWGGSL